METKRIVSAILFVFLVHSATAQNSEEVRKGLVLFQGNLAGGYRFNPGVFSAYVQGDTEWFLHNRVTIGGQIWYTIPLQNDALIHNHSLFAGIGIHPVKKSRIDPFVGFHPGITLAGERQRSMSVIPVFSASAGVNFYTGPLFHLFVKVQGVAGNFLGQNQTSTTLHEVRFSAGLAYHFNLPKKTYENYFPSKLAKGDIPDLFSERRLPLRE